jgi:hypothetical protein
MVDPLTFQPLGSLTRGVGGAEAAGDDPVTREPVHPRLAPAIRALPPEARRRFDTLVTWRVDAGADPAGAEELVFLIVRIEEAAAALERRAEQRRALMSDPWR